MNRFYLYVRTMIAGCALVGMVITFSACAEDNDDPLAPVGTTVLKMTVDGDLVDFPAISVTSVYDDMTKKVRITGNDPSSDPLDKPDQLMIISFTKDVGAISYPYSVTTADSLLITYRRITPNDTLTWLCDNSSDCSLMLTEGDQSKIEGTFSGTFSRQGGTETATITDGSFAVGLN